MGPWAWASVASTCCGFALAAGTAAAAHCRNWTMHAARYATAAHTLRRHCYCGLELKSVCMPAALRSSGRSRVRPTKYYITCTDRCNAAACVIRAFRSQEERPHSSQGRLRQAASVNGHAYVCIDANAGACMCVHGITDVGRMRAHSCYRASASCLGMATRRHHDMLLRPKPSLHRRATIGWGGLVHIDGTHVAALILAN